MRIIDFRSDTVTLPTLAMREAMFKACLGDDVYGEDPTVNRFEEMAAKLTGKEAALFVPSGTMANLVSLLTHCGRGDEVILGDQSHIFLNEAGGIAALGGITPHTIPNRPDGSLDLADLEGAVRADNIHFPTTRLICLENTHNRCHGAVLAPAYMEAVAAFARRHGLRIHLDGARIFNAAVALALPVSALALHADSVSFCVSKGLSAPAGSAVCGTTEFIGKARRIRKQLGGGMRQAGILAAAGIVALESMVGQLSSDHDHAKLLVSRLADIPGLAVDPQRVQTNIIYGELTRRGLSFEDFLQEIKKRGVLVSATGKNRFRMLTHYGIEREDILAATAAIKEVLTAPAPER